MNLEDIKNLTEILAFIAAGLFFGYKFVAGYFITNLSLSLACLRQESPLEGKDFLAVTAKLTKGERGSLDLHDAKVRVNWMSGHLIEALAGIERQSFSTERLGKTDRKVISFKRRSKKAPLLRLSPGEETSLSCCFEVPRESVCTVELVVLGSMRRIIPRTRIGQWRASSVSIPLPEIQRNGK